MSAADAWVDWEWIGDHRDVILGAVAQHLELTAIAVGVGLLLAFPAGLLAWHVEGTRGALLAGAGALYTIPSLALFAFFVPFTGLSVITAEIGLVAYTLLILIRNVVVGLAGVPYEVRDAAVGMGYRPVRRLLQVDLPLALPVIIAGVRIATVTTIGLVTITAVIGEGGLGQLILDGLNRQFKTPLVVGGVLSVALAVLADLALAGLQRRLTRWRRTA
ncbi:MAG: ABC transporter permease [Candidatus Dormibacteraeota bacterium]|nr:ABC transporter permease [Candidatus Dormibacteraeota bacterium]MBO0704441.1 ABC transporter permease [Candidatus Dormibacteraeota bacterium]MBO0760254.1 ABC transporter permease [Candidatus Dormibacteraeota bacterium]